MIPLPAPSHTPSLVVEQPPQRRSTAPEALLARPEFSVLPWIVLAVCLLAGAFSEWLRDDAAGRDWLAISGALAGSVVAVALAVVQHRTASLRPSTAAWLYVAGIGLVILGLAGLAIATDGLATPYYAGMLPLATYLGMIASRRAQPWLISTLFAVTVTVQVANPTTPLFDAAVVWALVVAGWACGVLGGLEHARLARIANRLASYDRTTRTLNRRAFLEHVDRALAAPNTEDQPIAVLIVDLCGFGAVNATHGEAAGDQLLQQVGETFAAVLPEDAELGRLGDDRFAVLLPGAPRSEAEAVGHRIRSFLHTHVDATVGIATCQVRSLSPDDLMRVAEAALRVCKADGVGMHVLVGGSTGTAGALRAIPTGPGPLRYCQIRSTGHLPRAIGNMALYSWVSTVSAGVVAVCGAVVIAAAWIGGDAGPANDLVRYGGLAWLVWALALAALTRVPAFTRPGLPGWLLLASTTALLTVGVCVAAYADGGLIAPLTGALFVKVVFDGATLPAPLARLTTLGVFLSWATLAAVSPADTQYLIPFQFVLLLGCFVLGAMGQRANVEMADHARMVGHTDDLTGLPNRAGFRDAADEAFLDSVTRTAAPFAVLWFGIQLPSHAAGTSLADRDRMVRQTADSVSLALPDAYVVGRTGELEFMAAVPRAGRHEALATARLVVDRTGPLPIARSGVATCPENGATPEALMRTATGLPPLAVHPSQATLTVPTRLYPGGPRADRRSASQT